MDLLESLPIPSSSPITRKKTSGGTSESDSRNFFQSVSTIAILETDAKNSWSSMKLLNYDTMYDISNCLMHWLYQNLSVLKVCCLGCGGQTFDSAAFPGCSLLLAISDWVSSDTL